MTRPTPARDGRERRNPQGAALRALFREQLWHLLALVEARRARAALARADAVLVEDVVEGTDPRLRIVSGYRRRLRASARTTLDHVARLVDGLPDPVALDRRRFAADPLVNALFASVRDLGDTCGGDRHLRDFFAAAHGAGADRAHFHLLASRSERTVPGVALSGTTIVRDVMQTNVGFSDHSVVAPCASVADARAAFERYLFERLVAEIRRHLASDVAATGRRPDPESHLETLRGLLERPGALLRISVERVAVSRLGVKTDCDAAPPADVFRLHLLAIGDRPARVVVPATFPRAEMPSSAALGVRERALLASL